MQEGEAGPARLARGQRRSAHHALLARGSPCSVHGPRRVVRPDRQWRGGLPGSLQALRSGQPGGRGGGERHASAGTAIGGTQATVGGPGTPVTHATWTEGDARLPCTAHPPPGARCGCGRAPRGTLAHPPPSWASRRSRSHSSPVCVSAAATFVQACGWSTCRLRRGHPVGTSARSTCAAPRQQSLGRRLLQMSPAVGGEGWGGAAAARGLVMHQRPPAFQGPAAGRPHLLDGFDEGPNGFAAQFRAAAAAPLPADVALARSSGARLREEARGRSRTLLLLVVRVALLMAGRKVGQRGLRWVYRMPDFPAAAPRRLQPPSRPASSRSPAQPAGRESTRLSAGSGRGTRRQARSCAMG